MAPSLSIETYKRKQKVDAAKAQKHRISTSSTQAPLRSTKSYTPDQRRYLNACIEANADPDSKLLMVLRKAQFVLKLDRFGKDELAFNMKFLQKTKTCSQIRVSLGSVATNRDLRSKFDRLGLRRAYAYEKEGAELIVRSACASAFKTPSLVRFHLIGVRISPTIVPLLSKALAHCRLLEDINLSGSDISDKGLEAIAIVLGNCPRLNLISLAGCSLTDKAKEPITKIIALHGVIKDEAVWSSSLRNQVLAAVSSPDLLINLSRNNLGDEIAEAICDGLYNDKWLLGLNLGGNNLSPNGTELFIDTLTKHNHTLAVLALANMKEPVEAATRTALDLILYDRNRNLQQIATESREKRMTLGALLLEWGIDKDTVVEVCYLESPGEDVKTKSVANTWTARKKTTLASPKCRIERVYSRSKADNNNHTCVSPSENDNQMEEEDEGNGNNEVAKTADSHIKTIEYLFEQLSSLEKEKRRMQEHITKIETENKQLRATLEARAKVRPAPGISLIEAQIIAQLESSISSLAEQVEFMEYKTQT